MEPKLSTEIMTGLKRMGNSTLVSDEVFVKSLQCGMTTITQPDFTSANLSSISSGSSKGDVVKEAHCALLSLFVESARLDLTLDSLTVFLETKANWPQTRCKMLADAYAACVSKVQACLSNISVHPPHIVDVQWSLNHNTKSSSNKQTTSSFVSVQFETEGLPEGQEDKLVKFECTLAELQDMVSKLKEALRQVEHIAHI
ncbi:COMM domain-containing protein 3 isoform X1 [Frankliniella occidentalis]|uniref:COMM domain-containing protein 3 n=1 Tax=Frankliniella occidentalis TaxID=133901 RepID=A0A6J1S6E2_FRAOC|nr:COMM domain-containing protein 3 isoform X1 [Frankliniella occidentalis]